MSSILKLLGICGFLGVLFCAYHNSWFIVFLPQQYHDIAPLHEEPESKKIDLVWWHDRQWQKESVDMIWPIDMRCIIEALIRKWLLVTAEEKHEHYATLFQAVLLSSSQKTIYFSCTKSPFHQQLSMQDKLLWIESLCRTLLNNGITATHIQLLVDHKPLSDAHLDFTYAWPMNGLVSNHT